MKNHLKKLIKHLSKRMRKGSSVSITSCDKGRSKTVIIFPIINWAFRHQRPQHMALNLSNLGWCVFYLTVDFYPKCTSKFTVVSTPNENIFEIRLGLHHSSFNVYSEEPTHEFTIDFVDSINALYSAFNIEKPVLLLQLPIWLRFIKKLDYSAVVYDCMDHHAGFSNITDYQLGLEKELLATSDLVIVSSARLYDKLSDVKRKILVRNACEYKHFSGVLRAQKNANKTGFVIGYYGAIAEWFDAELVEKIAKHFSFCRLELIGDVTTKEAKALGALPNVYMHGEVNYRKLPQLLEDIDVCIIPFLLNELTACTDPVKVYEYLSAGKPVVATDLPELENCKELIWSAKSHGEFIAYIEEAHRSLLSTSGYHERKQWAKQNDWEQRAKVLDKNINALFPKVSIILLTYNNLTFTRSCLHSLKEHTLYPNWELVIVDNASTDGTVDFLKAFSVNEDNVKLILNDRNLGFSAGNNVGLKRARGEYSIVLNNDTFVTPGWIFGFIKHFRANPKLGLLGPVTNNIGNEAKVDVHYKDLWEMVPQAKQYTLMHANELFYTDRVAFFCVVIPSVVLSSVGYLSEEFGQGFFEDDDYCRRVAGEGFEVAIAEDVFVHHHLSASFNKLPTEDKVKLFERNKKIYEDKWGEWKPHCYRETEDVN